MIQSLSIIYYSRMIAKFQILLLAAVFGTILGARRTPDEANTSRDLRQVNRLYNRLLDGSYNRDVRPVADQDDKITLRFSPSLVEVLDLDDDSGHMTMNMWVKSIWQDISLTWDPEVYGGLKEIHVPARDVWLPDVVLFNSFDSKTNKDLDVVVAYDGTVVWVAPTIYKMTCKHEFRGNTWKCPMRFGSWTFDSSKLDILPFGKSVKLGTSDYISSDIFEIVGAEGKRSEHKFECCEETYPVLEYLLLVRDRSIGNISFGKK